MVPCRACWNCRAAIRALYVDSNGNYLTLLPGPVCWSSAKSAVESVVDVADGATPSGESDIMPFLAALDSTTHISFVLRPAGVVRGREPRQDAAQRSRHERRIRRDRCW
ncbi:MAG: hypothetical protein IPG64_06215 [Haliea sp.]|nr:hypothetical protein [Haliea sp.]